MDKAIFKRINFTLFFLLICSALSFRVCAQLSQQQLTSAFIFNFIKHVTWPNENRKTSFNIAIYQDPALHQELANNISSKTVRNKTISVSLVNEAALLSNADLVFIPEKFNEQINELATLLRQSDTLLVTFNSTNKHNIMINLNFADSEGKITFEVNKSNIVYESLSMSNELLLLGGTEIDVAILYRETEKAMLLTKQRESELQTLLKSSQNALAKTKKELKTFENKIRAYQKDIQVNQSTLLELEKKVKQQQDEINQKEQSLSFFTQQLSAAELALTNTSNELNSAKENLNQQQSLLAESTKQQQTMAIKIEQNKQTLAEQENILAEREILLAKKNQTISHQKMTLSIIILITFISIILFIRNQLTNRKLSNTIDNLTRTQKQLVESEKMAALGNLVAGISHEINTPIGIGVTAASHIQDKTEELQNQFNSNKISKKYFTNFIDESTRTSALLLKNLNRAADLVASFKRISVDQTSDDLITTNIHQVISDTTSSVQIGYKNQKVNIVINCPKEAFVTSYPGAISQVINNLTANSFIHAFEEAKPNNEITITVSKIASGLKVKFQDNGKGIDNEGLANIFTPFYTTRRGKGGSGLGLHIVYNLVTEKLKSEINYGSEVSVGTWFEFNLYHLNK